MGSRSGRALLHQRHLYHDPGPPELHEVWEAGQGVPAVEVEAGGLRAAALRPAPLPRAREGQVHGLRGRLLGQEPHAVPTMPLVRGKHLADHHFFILDELDCSLDRSPISNSRLVDGDSIG